MTTAQHLHATLNAFHTLHIRYEEARTHLLLASLAQQQGHREALRSHLAAVHHLFRTLHVPYYVTYTERLAGDRRVVLS